MSDSEELACPKKGGCGKKKSSCAKKGCSGGDATPSIEKVVSDALGGFVKKHEEIEEKRENANRTQEKIEDVDKK
jgi:hypothetical protein|tara:strand:+ start:161 stop:385 length:225 start_codon:yes stop_codon:yes gene_type:complete